MSLSTRPSDRFDRLLSERRRLSSASLADSTSALAALEADLRLSAEVGQALLEEQKELQTRLTQADNAKNELLDRLAFSVRENAQLAKQLERVNNNLEAAEASNRTLLATLEEDRKTIGRLQTEQAKGAGSDSKLKALAREREDLRQELEAEKKRAAAADARARKASEKLASCEAKLARATREADETRHRGTAKDQEALSKAQALITLAASAPLSPKLGESSSSQGPPELLALVQSLVAENDALRTEAAELNEHLDAARDAQSGMQSEMDSRQAFLPDDEDGGASATLMSETLMKLEGARIERPTSPFGNDLSRSWAPSTSYANKRLSTFSQSSMSDVGGPAPPAHTHIHYHLPEAKAGGRLKRRRGSMRVLGGAPRLASRRTQSMDIDVRSSETDAEDFPRPRPYFASRTSSPHERAPPTAFSPLATLHDSVHSDLSSGAEPLSPTSHASPRQSLPSGPSGLSLSSPTRSRMLSLQKPETVDAGVQTDPPALPPPLKTSTASSTLPPPLSPMFSQTGRSTPELSLSDVGLEPGYEQRTAALVALIEHVTRLLARVKAADVASLEQRFKKQRLTGDVGHLSKATLREIVNDAENLREHFRRVLDQERAQHRPTLMGSEHESLVSRRDFVSLVKLLRDVFLELGRLRSLVNRIQIEPSLASRLAELDNPEILDLDALAKPLPSVGLLAPITRLFSSPSPPFSVASAGPPAMPAPPRPEPTAALAATTVNVEFGSAGIVRRAVSVAPKAEATTSASGTRPALGRRGLHGIFAGGQLGSGAPVSRQPRDQWVVLPNEGPPPPAGQLLQRQLRPRGLSDSSIHTTFDAHSGNPVHRVLTPAGLALSSQAVGGVATGTVGAPASTSREAILASLSERIRAFKTTPAPAASPSLAPAPTRPTPTTPTKVKPVGIPGSPPAPAPVAIRGESLGTNLGGNGLLGWTSWAASKAAALGTTPSQADLDQRPFVAPARRRDPDH